MTSSQMHPEVDEFLGKAKKWPKELAKLRAIALDCGLTEELKWYKPCYTFEDHNIAIIGEFKDYCALMFFKGALLKDDRGILTTPTENVQAGRQVRFTDVQQITSIEPILKVYINQAIAIEKAGLKINLKKTSDFAIAEEFQSKLDENPALKAAFDALTPGRQRGYLLHFAVPKQSKTRGSRVEKCLPRIFSGKGLDD
jgi:uncharacterized protein YdeI (YjbR/CyaY-like superfamily)